MSHPRYVDARVALLAALLAGALLLFGAAGARAAAPLEDTVVTPDEPGGFQQPLVSIDPTNPLRIAVSYMEGERQKACFLAQSTNGGRTWENTKLVGEGGRFSLPERFAECLDAQVLHGPDGTLYYLYEPRNVDHPLLQRRVYITTSKDGGPFTTPHDVDPTGPGADRTDLQSGMAVDRKSGRLYVGFIRFCEPPAPAGEPSAPTPGGVADCLPDFNKAMIAASGDGGRTFSPPVQVSPQTGATQPSRQFPAVDGAGNVYEFWIDASSDPRVMYVNSSTDQGRTYSAPKRVSATFAGDVDPDSDSDPCDPLHYPAYASNPYFHTLGGNRPGQLFVVQWDADRSAGLCRVSFQRSDDGGDSWTERRVVGIPPGAEDHQQHRPRLALAPDGTLYVAYYDIGPDNQQVVYQIESNDDGTTFSTPQKLTDVPSDATVGPAGRAEFADFGQWLGVDASPCGTVAAWTDTRRGDEVSGKQDVFAAGAPGYLHPAKLRVSRARVLRMDRRLDVLAPITSRAEGDVAVTFHADNRKDTFDGDVSEANTALDVIRISKRITRGQARLGTGIVNIDYLGDEDTRPQFVRLRAASQRARLDVDEISLVGDRLSARGSVTDRAQGVVRLRFSYVNPDGSPNVHLARARIQDDGDWKLEGEQVPAQLAQCGGYLSIQFTGYFPRRIRGEQLAYELNAGQTRRP